MYKKPITYTDYNGTERTENFYFNFTKAELMEMELGTAGGFVEKVNNIIAAQDQAELVKVFKDLVLSAYGVKSDDGRRFMKSEEIRNDFAQTEAYSILFMELATNAEKAAEFVNNVVPADLAKENK